jgi:phage tail protein X
MSDILGTYVVTEDEERIDRIARSIYGEEGNGAVELLLQANPGILERSVSEPGTFPFGTVLKVPPRPVPQDDSLVRPWQ